MKTSFICFSAAFFISLAPEIHAQDTPNTVNNASDVLKQDVDSLQSSPDDQALRERIIKLALTMNPPPGTPDEAITDEGAADYAFKNATTNSDYSDAAKEYEKALLIAPWVAADYYNCGVAHEKAGEYKDAMRNFNLYLLAAPNADDAVDVKRRIGGLQYAEQKIEDQQQQQAQAAQALEAQAEQARQVAQAQDEEWTRKMAGHWRYHQLKRNENVHFTFEVVNHQLIVTQIDDKDSYDQSGYQQTWKGRQRVVYQGYFYGKFSAPVVTVNTPDNVHRQAYEFSDDFSSVRKVDYMNGTRINRKPAKDTLTRD